MSRNVGHSMNLNHCDLLFIIPLTCIWLHHRIPYLQQYTLFNCHYFLSDALGFETGSIIGVSVFGLALLVGIISVIASSFGQTKKPAAAV